MAHGESDNVIPMTLAAASRRQLIELGYAVEWHEYRMAHSVCKEEIADIGEMAEADSNLNPLRGVRSLEFRNKTMQRA